MAIDPFTMLIFILGLIFSWPVMYVFLRHQPLYGKETHPWPPIPVLLTKVDAVEYMRELQAYRQFRGAWICCLRWPFPIGWSKLDSSCTAPRPTYRPGMLAKCHAVLWKLVVLCYLVTELVAFVLWVLRRVFDRAITDSQFIYLSSCAMFCVFVILILSIIQWRLCKGLIELGPNVSAKVRGGVIFVAVVPENELSNDIEFSVEDEQGQDLVSVSPVNDLQPHPVLPRADLDTLSQALIIHRGAE